MQLITSENNPRLKKAVRLHESRGRRQQGRIIIFGGREITRALQCQIDLVEFYVCPQLFSEEARNFVSRLDAGEAKKLMQLSPELFEKIAYGDRVDGLVAVANRPKTDVDQLNLQSGAFVLVLEAIEKPGNIGAVYRSAEAAGVNAIFLADAISDAFHPNAIRSSLGSVFSIPTATGTSESIRSFLASAEFTIAAARVDGQKTYFQLDMTGSIALVFGNETRGLSDAWSGPTVTDITIPMHGKSDSLNIAMTASVMSFEAQRQRIKKRQSGSTRRNRT